MVFFIYFHNFKLIIRLKNVFIKLNYFNMGLNKFIFNSYHDFNNTKMRLERFIIILNDNFVTQINFTY